jgi:hypothetical protein
VTFWQAAAEAPLGGERSTSSAHRLNRPEIPSGLALSFSNASPSMLPRALSKHLSKSAALKQRDPLMSSRAAREIAHGIWSFPSVISKRIRLPSQRGRDGEVTKNIMMITL